MMEKEERTLEIHERDNLMNTEKLKVTANQLNNIPIVVSTPEISTYAVYCGSLNNTDGFYGSKMTLNISQYAHISIVNIDILRQNTTYTFDVTKEYIKNQPDQDNTKILVVQGQNGTWDVYVTGSYGSSYKSGFISIVSDPSVPYTRPIGELVLVSDLPSYTEFLIKNIEYAVKDIKKLEYLPISSTNTYSPKNIIYANNVGERPIINIGSIDAPNGFLLVGSISLKSAFRINKVFDSNGKYIISFDIRGTQTTNLGAFDFEYNDQFLDTIYVTEDNDWRHYEYTVTVNNYSNIYNFIDFENIGHIYILIKDLQVRKCNDIGYVLPVDTTVSKQIFEIGDANEAIESGITYQILDVTTNKPTVYGGVLKVTNLGTHIFHTFHCVDNTVWTRVYKNGVGWSSWRQTTNI